MDLRLVAGAAALAFSISSCKSSSNFHAEIDIQQWTPDLSASVEDADGYDLDLVDQGNVPDDDMLWVIDAKLQTSSYSLNLGYSKHTYSGTGPGGFVFDGVDLDADTCTNADIALYKIGWEDLSGSTSGNSMSAGSLGLHWLDFDVTASDGVDLAHYSDRAILFVLGYRMAYYSNGLYYYINLESTVGDLVSLGNSEGEILEYSAGVRWFIYEQKAAVSIGYRSYEADIDMRDGEIDLELEGVFFSLYMRF